MDEQTNNETTHEPEFANPSKPENVTSNDAPAADSAGGDTANRLRAEAQKTLNQIKGGDGIMGLFSFEKMYFPFFARVIFIIYCILMVLTGLFLAASALYLMFTASFLDGLLGLFISGLFVIASIIMGRIWIELIMIGFSINESVQDIRDMLRAKNQ